MAEKVTLATIPTAMLGSPEGVRDPQLWLDFAIRLGPKPSGLVLNLHAP